MGVENTSGFGLGTGLALGAFGSIASSVISGISNYFANRRNLDFSRKQFEYGKYLNANQFQIHAADAQAAGINPIAMQGGSMQTGSVSAGQQGFDPTSSIASLMSLISTAMTNKSSEKQTDANINANKPYIEAQASEANARTAQINQETATQKQIDEERIKQAQIQTNIMTNQNKDYLFNRQREIAENARRNAELISRLRSQGINDRSSAYDLYIYLKTGFKSSDSGNNIELAAKVLSKFGVAALSKIGVTESFEDWCASLGLDFGDNFKPIELKD